MKAGLWVIESSLYNCTHCKVLDLIISQLSKQFYAIFINWKIGKLLNNIAIHWTHLLLYFTALFLFLPWLRSILEYFYAAFMQSSYLWSCKIYSCFLFKLKHRWSPIAITLSKDSSVSMVGRSQIHLSRTWSPVSFMTCHRCHRARRA